jgi:hypothetical protein
MKKSQNNNNNNNKVSFASTNECINIKHCRFSISRFVWISVSDFIVFLFRFCSCSSHEWNLSAQAGRSDMHENFVDRMTIRRKKMDLNWRTVATHWLSKRVADWWRLGKLARFWPAKALCQSENLLKISILSCCWCCFYCRWQTFK